MATKLNQIIAVRKGVMSQYARWESAMLHLIQKGDLFNGLTRTYQPRDDEGQNLPPEGVRVQAKMQGPDGILAQLQRELTRVWDLTATQDVANQQARADVVLDDGTVLLTDIPATYLIALEKQLINLRTILSKAPLLDPTQDWTWDANRDQHVAAAVTTTRSRKVPKAFVKAPATDKHPAQVDVFHEDVIVGDLTLVNMSGALPASRQRELLGRVEELVNAVKKAREDANSLAVVDQHVAGPVFGWLFR